MASVALREIAEQLGGELIGDGTLIVDRIGPLDRATPSTISFLAQPRWRSQLPSSRAACVIVGAADRDAAAARGAAIVTSDPYAYYARLTRWWAARERPAASPSVHPSAVIDDRASVDERATIGPLVVIEAGAAIAAGAVIGAHSVIGAEARVGPGSRLAPHVTLGERCVVGARCIVHSGVVIGADGFGFAPFEGRWEKIEQLGAVRIVIEDGVKLDNLIQIGHNVRVGAHTVMAACVGVAGSADIGARCMIGGAALIAGHLRLAEGLEITAGSFVMRSILKPGRYSGVFPIDDNAAWEKNAATLRQLHTLRDRLRALEKNAARSPTP